MNRHAITASVRKRGAIGSSYSQVFVIEAIDSETARRRYWSDRSERDDYETNYIARIVPADSAPETGAGVQP